MKKTTLLFALCLAAMSANAQTKPNESAFQVSFFSPLGTNGMQSARTTNSYSLNLLGGISAANKVLELGSLFNINHQYTSGFQAAGIFNYSGKLKETFQFAGVTNVAKSGEAACQAAGVANISEDVEGLQAAGVANVSEEVDGLQAAGVLNVGESVDGVQAAGVLNIAEDVEGVQLGLINIAESYKSGTPIGLISIVKEGGKSEFEVSLSEAIHTAVSYKIGTDHFYTIFSGGINYIGKTVNYAAGAGFGTHLDWQKGWGNQIEALCYTLSEEGKFRKGLNLLTQLRLTASKEIAPHFKVFAGPVINLTISDYVNPDTKKVGSSLDPYSLWENEGGKTTLRGWVGIAAGVRF